MRSPWYESSQCCCWKRKLPVSAENDTGGASTGYRQGSQPGSIVAAGRKKSAVRPRVRNKAGEVKLSRYELMRHRNAMPEATVKRMVVGVSTRNYRGVVEAARKGYGIEKSSISRYFIRASEEALRRLRERRFDGVRFAAILIDGKEFSGTQIVCAQGVTESGEKVILGLKALRAAVSRVFGDRAVVQRCQVHKKRNVASYLSAERWKDGSMRLRWCAAGLLEAGKKFRKVRGFREMPTLMYELNRKLGADVDLRKSAA